MTSATKNINNSSGTSETCAGCSKLTKSQLECSVCKDLHSEMTIARSFFCTHKCYRSNYGEHKLVHSMAIRTKKAEKMSKMMKDNMGMRAAQACFDSKLYTKAEKRYRNMIDVFGKSGNKVAQANAQMMLAQCRMEIWDSQSSSPKKKEVNKLMEELDKTIDMYNARSIIFIVCAIGFWYIFCYITYSQ
eukprot:206868_1